jgi:hypothetical protein
VINLLPEPFEVPNPAPAPAGILPPPEEPTQFFPHTAEGESSATSRPLLDPDLLISKMAVAQPVISGTGFDSDLLLSRLAVDWTVEKAIRNGQLIPPRHMSRANRSRRAFLVRPRQASGGCAL